MIEDLGAQGEKYYALGITSFKSPLDLHCLDLQWNRLWGNGSNSPLLFGIRIWIFVASDNSDTALQDSELLLDVTIGTDGSLLGSPLYDDGGYNDEASRPSYQLNQVESYSFSCQKLSPISIYIHRKDDNAEPIPLILFSLRGDNGYMDNSVYGVERTTLLDVLSLGMYFLCPA